VHGRPLARPNKAMHRVIGALSSPARRVRKELSLQDTMKAPVAADFERH
jgi:hypothetical protein